MKVHETIRPSMSARPSSYIKGNITQLITRGTSRLTASRAGPRSADQDLSIRTEQGSFPRKMEKNKRIFSGYKKDQKGLDPLIKNHVTHQHGQKKNGRPHSWSIQPQNQQKPLTPFWFSEKKIGPTQPFFIIFCPACVRVSSEKREM